VIDLAKLRRKAGVTQEQLAGFLGTSQGQISRLEGQQDMLVSTLGAYLAALGFEAKVVIGLGQETVAYELTAEKGER
jgi:transcriptional regulator with XRE-family HTH domain